MTIICKTCLKYPVCKFKQEVHCEDIVVWLLEYETGTVDFLKRLQEFERWWGTEVAVISPNIVQFKKEDDNFQCIIMREPL